MISNMSKHSELQSLTIHPEEFELTTKLSLNFIATMLPCQISRSDQQVTWVGEESFRVAHWVLGRKPHPSSHRWRTARPSSGQLFAWESCAACWWRFFAINGKRWNETSALLAKLFDAPIHRWLIASVAVNSCIEQNTPIVTTSKLAWVEITCQ